MQLDSQKMIKICIIGFLGGILEGMIGFGFYFSMLLYLVHTGTTLKSAIATCGFTNVFTGAIFTLNYIFCGSFNLFGYLAVFFTVLAGGILTQYLLELYMNANVKPSSLNSTLVGIIIFIAGLCFIFVVTSFGLNWSRFGLDNISSFLVNKKK